MGQCSFKLSKLKQLSTTIQPILITFLLRHILLLVPTNSLSHLSKGFELLGRDELKLLYKVVEMLVARIYMRFRSYADDPIKVMDIHMNKHPKETRQDLATQRRKRLWKRNVCGHGEDVLIIDL